MSRLDWNPEKMEHLLLWGKIEGRYVVEVEKDDDEVIMKIYDTQKGDFIIEEVSYDAEDVKVKRLEEDALMLTSAYENDEYDVDDLFEDRWGEDEYELV